ncbi:MAG: CHAP domain-containing protein [Rhizomicrobium sp.]
MCAFLGGCGGLSTGALTDADFRYPHSARTADNERLPFPGDEDATPSNTPSTIEGTALQCVPYAREHSGVNIHGDAYTWWDKAAGLYARGVTPLLGSVMVLNGYARKRAHVAVVRALVNAREILINHANWLDDGAIYVNDPVKDVSEDNDWTQVKVWNIRTGSWGTRIYNVQGFIGPGPADNPVVASNDYGFYNQGDLIARQIAMTDGGTGTNDR